VPYLSASEVMMQYEEALYQVYVPVPYLHHMGHVSVMVYKSVVSCGVVL